MNGKNAINMVRDRLSSNDTLPQAEVNYLLLMCMLSLDENLSVLSGKVNANETKIEKHDEYLTGTVKPFMRIAAAIGTAVLLALIALLWGIFTGQVTLGF